MEFLEKLYSQEYFAPVLFVIIAILAVLFIIVLVLALKDAKKNKNKVEGQSVDTFAATQVAPQEVNVEVPQSVEPVVENQQNNIEEVNEENVISSVEPTSNDFENVQVEAPVAEVAPVLNDNQEQTVAPVQEIVHPVQEVEAPNVFPTEPQINDIKVEESPVASAEDVAKAEDDLDAIAATLLSEYQKDDNVEEKNDAAKEVVSQPEQISPVFVTPNTLPVAEEQSAVEMPNLADIPSPQPVRVTETSTVIDSSKQNIDNIQTEEYNLNK